MMFRLVDAGLTAIMASVIFAAGCGMTAVQSPRGVNDLPLSNMQIMEKAVWEALENAGVSEGNNEPLRLEFRGEEGMPESLLTVLVPGFLKNLGYEVSESGVHSSVVMVRADTMAVSLNIERRLFGRDRVLRLAEVSLVLEKHGSNGTKSVYEGSYAASDEFPLTYLLAVGNGETFVTVYDTGNILSGNHGKPLVLGITMTALVWLLYAYRG